MLTRRSGNRSAAVLVACVFLAGCGGSTEDVDAPIETVANDVVPVPESYGPFDEDSARHMQACAEAVRESPDDIDAWTRLGMVYQANDLDDLAVRCYDRVIGMSPDATRTRYYAAILEFDRGNRDRALDHLTRVRRLAPEYVSAHTRAGAWYLEAGIPSAARAAFDDAILRAPLEPAANRGLARIDIQARNWDDAIARLESYLESVPDDTAAQFLLAAAYRGAGRTDDAARIMPADAQQNVVDGHDAWASEVMLERRGFRPQLTRASQLTRLGDPEEAARILEALREQSPDEALVHINLHQAYRALGRTDEALECLRTALELRPYFHMVHLYFAGALLQKAAEIDDDAEARMLIERALDHANTTVQIRPTFAAGHRMRADALNLLDRPVESAQAQLRTAELERDDPVLYLAAGLRLIQTSQWDDAISALHRLDELEPDNPRTLYLLGSALINRGDVEDGRGVLERALSLAPGEERIIAVLKQLDDPDAESTPE